MVIERKKEKLDRLLVALKEVGVEQGARNRTVAEKTGYSEKTVGNLLSGHAAITDRFIWAVGTAFGINSTWITLGSEPILTESLPIPVTGKQMSPEDMERVDREAFGLVSDERKKDESAILTVIHKRWLTDDEVKQVERLISDFMDRKK